MEKELELIELFEIYGELLTEKQRKLFSSYYLYDLSLSEIAEEEGGTRQSVFDAIKKVKQKLWDFESALNIRNTKEKLKQIEGKTTDKQTAKLIREIIER